MDWELAYMLANATATAAWLPLLLAPRSRFTRAFTATPLAPLALALAYVALTFVMLAGDGGGSMASLAQLRVGFASDPVLLLAWVHYLSFDLLVGFWEVRDSARQRLSVWAVAPCLLLTFLLGPAGLALYLGLRLAQRGSLRFDLPPPAA
jgi:hypothetical protein